MLALAALLLLALVIVGTPFRSAPLSRWFPLAVLSATGIAGWAVTLRWPAPALVWPLTAVVGLVVASGISALASAYPSLAWDSTWSLAMLGGTGLLIWRAAGTPVGRRNLLALAAIFLIVILVVFLGQAVVLWRDWLVLGMPIAALPLRPAATGGIVGLPTWVGDYIVLLTPVVAVSLWQGGRSGRLAAGVLTVVAASALLLTGTRSLWLIAVLVGLGVLAVAARRRGVSPRLIWSCLLALVAILAFAWQLGLVSRVTRDLDEGRSSAYASAIRQAGARPILGGGPGTYGVYRLSNDLPIFAHYAFPNAHNIVLNALAETGLVGLAALLAAGFLGALQVRRTWRHAGDRRPVVVAALAGLLAVLAHSMVDVVFEVPGILILSFVVAAFAFTTPGDVPAAPEASAVGLQGLRRRSRWAAMGVFLVLLVALPTVVRAEASAAEQLRSRLDGGADSATAQAAARRSVDLAPDVVPALTALVLAADAAGDSATALDAAARRTELEGLQQHRIELGILLARSGRLEEAALSLRAAAERDAVDPFVQLNVALLDASGQTADERTLALRRLIASQPLFGLVSSELPSSVAPLLGPATDGAVADLLARGQVDDAMRAALVGGDAALVDSVVAGADSPAKAFYADVAAAWAGSVEADGRVRATATEHPTAVNGAWWAWLLSVRRCDRPEAHRWSEIWRIATGAIVAMPIGLGTVPALDGSMVPQWYPESIWGVGGPGEPYVPGTWVIALGTPVCAR